MNVLIFMVLIGAISGQEDTEKLVVNAGVPGSWDLGELLGKRLNISEDDVIKFWLEGNSPCEIEESSFDLNREFVYKDEGEIKDFAVCDGTVYYIAGSEVKTAKIRNDSTVAFDKILFSGANTRYSYIEVIQFSNEDLLIFLKNHTFGLSYMVYDEPNEKIMTRTLSGLQNFADDMKIVSYQNFVFIPGRRNGLFIYKYDSARRTLELETTLFNNSADINPVDIRDVAVLETALDKSYVILLIADYNKGIIEVAFNTRISETEYRASFGELVYAKNVFSAGSRVVVILEGDGVSKYIFLNYSAEAGYLQFEFQDSLIIDGNVRYGDADKRLSVLILKNSLMVSQIGEKDEIKYVSLPGITHAKLYNRRTLLFAKYNELIVDKISFYNASLHCHTHRKGHTYEFAIMAENLACGNAECMHKVKMTLEVKEVKTPGFFKEHWEVAVLLGALIAGFVVATYCFVRAYKRIRERLEHYEQIASARENLPEAV